LRKNWLPSLVKNLEPLAVIVGMACTMLARRPRTRKNNMCAVKAVEKAIREDMRDIGDNLRALKTPEWAKRMKRWRGGGSGMTEGFGE
jgi:hypothetical protein